MRGLSPAEKLVLLALANFANEKMQCWPSQERLAADTELSARTVWSALKSLTDKGMLQRTSRKRSDGTRTTDVFTLHFAVEIRSEPVADFANSTRKSCEHQSQFLQEPVAAVARPTTFEPSVNHQIDEPVGGEGADAWPETDLAKSLCTEVASPWVDVDKSTSLILSGGVVASWKQAGASWSQDVVPVIRAMAAQRRQPISSWAYFDRAVLQALADRTRAVELPDACSTGPPSGTSFTAQRSAEQAEVRRRVMESENG
jgi:hypothetical protein